jgi:methyl-accepting chemotaxis protein
MLYPESKELKIPSNSIENKDDLFERFDAIISFLKEIFAESEKHFNLISQKLQHFYHCSKEITQTAVKVTGLITSDEFNKRLRELDLLFKEVNDYLEESGNSFYKSRQSLGEINKLLSKSAEGVAGFNKICRHLEMQSISIKIESSRLGNDDKGFSHLSDDIHKLADSISRQSKGFKEKAKSLVTTTSLVEKQVLSLITDQEANSKCILKNTRESLNLLTEEYELSSKKAYSITEKTETIQKRTGTLVTSIQFHDITRQQMEHVEQVIRDITAKLSKSLNNDALENYPELMAFMRNVCQLQSAQMDNSRKELFNAVSEIISGHGIIKEEIAGVSNDAVTLFKNGGDDDSSFINKVKNGFDSVISTLVRNEDVKKDFTSSTDNVIKTIEELSQFVNEINGIGSEIELLALNANIKAAHTGPEGASLGVLAEAIQRLSSDSRNHTNSVIGILMKTQDVSGELKTIGNSNNISKLMAFSEKIKDIFNSLNQIYEEGIQGVNSIQYSTNNLQNEIHDSVSTLEEYFALKTQIEHIVNILDDIVNQTSAFAHVEFDRSLLEEIGINYTMQVQRDIHNNITSGESPENVNTEEPEPSPEMSDEFGSNIELF